MADNEEYSSESDDEDYVPSCEESDEQVSDINEENEEESSNNLKRKKTANNRKNRKRRGQIFEDDTIEENGSETTSEIEKPTETIVNVEKEKARADALWSSFLEDTKPKPRTVVGSGLGSLCSAKSPSVAPKDVSETSKAKISITKEYNFAGEVISVEEKLDVNSKEAKKVLATSQVLPPKTETSSASSGKVSGGLGSILSKIQGKPKMSTLEKSRLDWCQFKTEQGIEEELQTHNKGKDGYIEKQAFLQRADLRQFEIERNMRMTNRSKR